MHLEACLSKFYEAREQFFQSIGHADFLRSCLGAFFCSGFDASEIHAGGSLAGNDSSEASSTGSGFCGSLLESRLARSVDCGGEDFCFSAGFVIAS
jgi:hypothetical protein